MEYYSDASDFLANLSSKFVDNIHLKSLIIHHAHVASLAGFFNGIKFQ